MHRQFLFDALDNLPFFVAVLTPAGEVVHANRACYEVSGVTPAEVMGLHLADTPWYVDDPPARDIIREAVGAAIGGRRVRREVQARLRTGELLDLDFFVGPMASATGPLPWLIASAVDVTEQRRVERARREGDRLLRHLADSLPMLVSYVGRDLRYRLVNRRYQEWLGRPPDDLVGRTVAEVVGPVAMEAIRPRLEAVLSGRPVSFEEHIRYHDRARHVHAEFMPHVGEGGVVEGFFAAVTDISERRSAEERERLLMREVDHRAKNALAVVQALVRLTRADSVQAYAEAVEARVAALARAHGLLARGRWQGADLRELVAEEVGPYAGPDGLSLAGDAVALGADSVQPLSLVLHELAVNAAKHGALSRPGGRVSVSWRRAGGTGGLELLWREEGGPEIGAPPSRSGFGSKLFGEAALHQLGGTADFAWERQGLVCRLSLGATALAADDRPS